jgi:hypothetical protein
MGIEAIPMMDDISAVFFKGLLFLWVKPPLYRLEINFHLSSVSKHLGGKFRKISCVEISQNERRLITFPKGSNASERVGWR